MYLKRLERSVEAVVLLIARVRELCCCSSASVNTFSVSLSRSRKMHSHKHLRCHFFYKFSLIYVFILNLYFKVKDHIVGNGGHSWH